MDIKPSKQPDVTPSPAPHQVSPNMHANAPQPEQTDPIAPQPEAPQTTHRQRRKPHHSLGGFLSLLQLVVGAFVLAFVINKVIFQSYEVFGQSMAPTLHDGDRLIINKLGKSWSSILGNQYLPERGEIIVFHNPNNEEVQLVKRVIGLPGDTVVVTSGRIVVYAPDNLNGIDFDQEFGLSLSPTVGDVDLKVPDGELFVTGDNRGPGGSLDSRNELGTVPLNDVVGDLAFRIYPLNSVHKF
jgi:signal peptidase I